MTYPQNTATLWWPASKLNNGRRRNVCGKLDTDGGRTSNYGNNWHSECVQWLNSRKTRPFIQWQICVVGLIKIHGGSKVIFNRKLCRVFKSGYNVAMYNHVLQCCINKLQLRLPEVVQNTFQHYVIIWYYVVVCNTRLLYVYFTYYMLQHKHPDANIRTSAIRRSTLTSLSIYL